MPASRIRAKLALRITGRRRTVGADGARSALPVPGDPSAVSTRAPEAPAAASGPPPADPAPSASAVSAMWLPMAAAQPCEQRRGESDHDQQADRTEDGKR